METRPLINLNDYENGKDKEWLKQHPGRQTGSVTSPIEFPVKWLITLDGLRGENEKLKFSMSKIKGMAENCVLNSTWRKNNPMTLEVHHNQEVYIFDGNHRARAAKIAGLDTYPCIINFYGGSEDKFNVQKIIKKYAMEESAMTNQEKQIKTMEILVRKAKIAIETGLNHKEVIAEINKLADTSVGDQSGYPMDQEYMNADSRGEEIDGENNPDKDEQRRTGPRNDMIQEASTTNAICATCSMPSDKCQCMKATQNQKPGGYDTMKKLDPKLNPAKTAAFDMVVALIKDSAKMTREASHMEEIEIPFKDLNLEEGINYHMSGRADEVSRLVDRYLRAYVYQGNRRYTVARLEQSMNKWFVKVLVFDAQIEHEGGIDTNNDGLRKVSSVKPNNLQKTAWKKRLTEVIGNNDETGLVKCPIEGGFLTRSCGTCPFAGNPHTYIVDGAVDCHFDEGPVWLNNLGVKEHKPLDSR